MQESLTIQAVSLAQRVVYKSFYMSIKLTTCTPARRRQAFE